jgi:ribosomal protein S18 acetylase RimI-like enzyme
MMEHHATLDARFRMGERAIVEQRQVIAKLLADSNADVIVAELGGRVIGFLTVQIGLASPVHSYSHYGWIGDVCVAPECRGQGIGSCLAAAALEWFRRKQIAVVQLNVAACNGPARGFWEKVGFRPYLERLWLELEGEGD